MREQPLCGAALLLVECRRMPPFVLATLAIIIGTFAWGALRGAPWVPTRRRDLDRIVALAHARAGERVADLGCGTGGVLVGFAARGCRVRGWELAILPWLVARVRFWRTPGAQIRYGDFWYTNLADCDVVYAFLMPASLARLAPKLAAELKSGARVITYTWPLPGWPPIAVDRAADAIPIFSYRVV